MTKTLLVVDDEPQISRLRGYLEQGGFRVLTAEGERLGPAVFEHERPDIVLLDLMLPGMDGLDVRRATREDRQDAG